MTRWTAIVAMVFYAVSLTVASADEAGLAQAKETNARLDRLEKLMIDLVSATQKGDVAMLRQPRIVPGVNVSGCSHMAPCAPLRDLCRALGLNGNNVALMLNSSTPNVATHAVCYS